MKPVPSAWYRQNARAPLIWLLAALPLLAFLIPTRWIERHPPPCLFTVALGARCPGCGMTRAVSCAAHGRFRDALRYNPLVVIVLPLAVVEWLMGMHGLIKDLQLPAERDALSRHV